MVTQRNDDAVAECAACSRPIVRPVEKGKDFCSEECKKIGRSYCKYCDKPLVQLPPGKGIRKSFCDKLCTKRYHRIEGEISSLPLKELNRSRCKACDKPMSVPPNQRHKKQFCSDHCRDNYHYTGGSTGQSLVDEWGMYGPETRRALREVQELLGRKMGPGMAKRLAIAIDREYILRNKRQRRTPLIKRSRKGLVNGEHAIYVCKTCGKQFRRKLWAHTDKEYCSPRHRSLGESDSPKKVFTWEEIDEIRNLYALGNITQSDIGIKYDVHRKTIGDIVMYRTWKPENDPRKQINQ